ncbi:hypothetical protein [Erythrobacter sp. THAF29]|uniref:hypothetical protein n=1 Tax=Erythrobacter sp. THAF29 TaxID=2587851 RepID=UPI001267F27B|nr:hypothetical protein [Erythrobacter sp. THAF29]
MPAFSSIEPVADSLRLLDDRVDFRLLAAFMRVADRFLEPFWCFDGLRIGARLCKPFGERLALRIAVRACVAFD